MKLLAIDTSTQTMGVSLFDIEKKTTLASVTTNIIQNHSTSLMSTIANVMDWTESDMDDVKVIGATYGPGSYTGIRIGVTTTKVLSWVKNIPLYYASSLAVLAMNGGRWNGLVVPMIDARRGRVYSGIYQLENEALIERKEDHVVQLDEWLQEIKKYDHPTLFLGDSHYFEEKIIGVLKSQATFGTFVDRTPRTSQLIKLTLTKWMNKEPQENSMAPNYCQVTEVEKKLLKENGYEDNP